jgi:hypothetical protein
MRIRIDIDDSSDEPVSTNGAAPESGATDSTDSTDSTAVPADLHARARAMGAISAGVAPSGPPSSATGPQLLADPGTADAATVGNAMSSDVDLAQAAGAAPGYGGIGASS